MKPSSPPAVWSELPKPIYEFTINFEEAFCVAPPTNGKFDAEPIMVFDAVLFEPEN
jgi:hypothetical protein